MNITDAADYISFEAHENARKVDRKLLAEQRRVIEQQAKEIEQWKAAAQLNNGIYEPLKQQITKLREALQLLHDYQNGCPLPSYEKGWTRAMALTCEALKEHS